jgi:hypothetical protein
VSQEHDDIHAQMAALADGTLPASRRDSLLARIESSPTLVAELERQRDSVAVLRSLEDVQAPPALRRSVQALVDRAPARRRGVALRWRLVGAGALALAGVLAFVLALTARTTGQPTVVQAARLALEPATLASPTELPGNRDVLAGSVEGIAYPYWQRDFGWRAAGARVDRLGGRTVTTVFYTHANATHATPARIGYAIVAGRALALPGGTVSTVHGIRFHTLASAGATIVTWRRSGHTCVLAARGVPAPTLVRLAAWE